MSYIDRIKVGDITYTLGQGAGTAVGTGTVLWENPDPTAEFPAQSITLSSSDYDYLEVVFNAGKSCFIEKIRKGKNVSAHQVIGMESGNYLGVRYRFLTYVDDVTYSAGDGILKKCNVTTAGEVFNTILVPWLVVGYKNESNTTGQGDIEIITGSEYKTGQTIDGKEEYGLKINCGALPNNTTKTIAFNVANMEYIHEVKGVARTTDGITIPLPHSDPIQLNRVVSVFADKTQVYIKTGDDKTAYTGNVTIFYTKND